MKYLFLILILTLSACSSSTEEDPKDKKDPEKKDIKIPKQIIGRIASVSTTGGFALIQKYSVGKMPVNAIIQSNGPNGRQASLKPSGERVQNFFAADILDGDAKIGDAVVAYFDQEKKEDITPDEKEYEGGKAEMPPEKEESEAAKSEIKN